MREIHPFQFGFGYRGALITFLECIRRGVEKAKAEQRAKAVT